MHGPKYVWAVTSLQSDSQAAQLNTRLPVYSKTGSDDLSDGIRRLCEIEAIQVHHFTPSCDKVLDELLFCVGASIDFGQRAKHGV